MKKPYTILLAFILLLATACSREDISPTNPEAQLAAGPAIQLVPDSLDLPPLINSISPPPYVNARHYTFPSPANGGQDVGFTLVTSTTFVPNPNQPVKAFVFLHGQGGSEHSGLVNYIPNLYQTGLLADDAVYILLNGITNGGGSWEDKPLQGYHPIPTIRECIDALHFDPNFDYISDDPADWTLIGFSMGGRAAMSTAFNPDFLNWQRMPATIYPMGSWLSTENLNEMIDFDAALANLSAFLPQRMDINVITHTLDRGGDNSPTLKVDVTDPFVANLNSAGFTIPNIHISTPRPGCLPSAPQVGPCNVHKIHVYLEHPVPGNPSETIGERIHQ